MTKDRRKSCSICGKVVISKEDKDKFFDKKPSGDYYGFCKNPKCKTGYSRYIRELQTGKKVITKEERIEKIRQRFRNWCITKEFR